MGRLVRTSIALAALGLARGLEAQGPVGPPPEWHVDLAVMAGYRFESTITFEFPGDYDRIEVDDAPTWGVALGYGPNPNWEFELQYSYTRAPATAIGTNPRVVNQSFDLGLHDFQLGVLGYLVSAQEKLRPYVELSLGTTLINTGEGFGNTAHFSLAVALGLKYYFNEHLGLRAEVHYIPVYLYSSGESGVWLCIEDFCWDTGSRFLQQFDLRAGATFRF